GSHTVSFGAVSGYITPSSTTVSVTSGLTTSVTGTYTAAPLNGTLSVSTTPVTGEVFVDSVSWGMAPVSRSVAAGSHTVSFGLVLGYTSPANVIVSVTAGATTSVTGTYTQTSPLGSALHVSGSKIVNGDGVEVKLVGFNYGQFPDAYWLSPRNYKQEAINIKNDGFNAVRLVLQWGALETSSGASAFTYNEANFTDFLKMVNSLTDQGLYVIIKLHMDGEPRYQYSNLKSFLGDQYCNEDPDVGNSYNSKLGDSFYYESSAANPTGSFAHFTKMWEKISVATRNNSRVVGYDLLNEPWTCVTKTASQAVPIRAGWVARVGELIADLRSKGDNKIVFYEPSPMWWRYGDAYQGLTFTKQSDNNVVYSWHWYEGTESEGSKHACAELSSIERLTDLWGNVNLNVNANCKQEGVWLKQAQDANPNVPFDIGEFGNIYTNSEGDVDQTWIRNSIQLFKNMHVTGYFYWASHTTGTWISDIQASLPWTGTSSLFTLNSLAAVSAHKTGSTTNSPIMKDTPQPWDGGESVHHGDVTVNLSTREYAKKD
ncbi:MAG: cellulase family glycosylhydrolase, partial [Thaumarchaeota archaeon]|nr:cellulase family glycosylhydrolase [Nitrososphaerota archaeon]